MQSVRLANGPERRTDWDTVDWRRAHRIVRNLRSRIFRATREDEIKTVRSLQKLMLRSFSNILVSVRRVTQTNAGKNTPGVDRIVVKTPRARGQLVDHLTTFLAFPKVDGVRVRGVNSERGEHRWPAGPTPASSSSRPSAC